MLEQNNKEIKIVAVSDDMKYNIKDSVNKVKNKNIPRQNKVVITTLDKKTNEILDKTVSTNLVVYHGRSWVAQRLFDQSIDSTIRPDYEKMYIKYFALGSGGCEYVEGGYNVIPVKLVDYRLDNQLPVVQGTYSVPDDCTRILIDSSTFYDFHNFTNVEFLTDPDVVPGDSKGIEDPDYDLMENILIGNYKADSYLVVKVTVTVGSDEYNGPAYYGLVGDYSQNINEAGLFFSVNNPSSDKLPQLYAKLHFPTKVKDSTQILTFEWYLLF